MVTGDSLFSGLLDAAPDAIVAVDAEGRIIFVNRQAESLFGYDRGELLGEFVEILVPEAVGGVHPRLRYGYVLDPRPRPMGAGIQLAARRKDGSEFPADISLNALQTDNGLVVSAGVRDVSERLEAEAERERLRAQAERERFEARLHRTQRLESLGQLAGGVAHDFNNLMAVVLNYTAFITEEVTQAAAQPGGRRWERVCHDLEQVQRAAQRATELTHQLLAFGRREVVQPVPLNLDDVANGLAPLLRRTIGEHVKLDIHPSAGLWSVLADPGQLEQVLMNLAINARDAMVSGGTITITTENIVVDEDYASAHHDVYPGRYVRLRVSDTGQGMPREVAERAFEPFYTTKPKGEGSGLGLATVYGIITQAGGAAQIYSVEGMGTTFTALFPVTEQTADVPEAATEEKRLSGGETVLLVEDEEAMREVTKRILNRNGHTVLLAAGGSEAVDVARNHQGTIDLVLTDVVMPEMLGKEVAARVQEVRPEIRVLYMSGYAQPVLASQGTLDPGVTLVEKPFSEAGLLAKVREVLDREGAS